MPKPMAPFPVISVQTFFHLVEGSAFLPLGVVINFVFGGDNVLSRCRSFFFRVGNDALHDKRFFEHQSAESHLYSVRDNKVFLPGQ